MAFINQKLTKEEINILREKKYYNTVFEPDPTRWTINKNKNISLLFKRQGREEDSDRYYFLLIWKDIPIKFELKLSFPTNNVEEWELLKFALDQFNVDNNNELSNVLQENRKDIIDDLKEALSIYGFNGNPDDPRNTYAKIQFSF